MLGFLFLWGLSGLAECPECKSTGYVIGLGGKWKCTKGCPPPASPSVPVASATTSACPDCKGTGTYQGLSEVSPCLSCQAPKIKVPESKTSNPDAKTQHRIVTDDDRHIATAFRFSEYEPWWLIAEGWDCPIGPYNTLDWALASPELEDLMS